MGSDIPPNEPNMNQMNPQNLEQPVSSGTMSAMDQHIRCETSNPSTVRLSEMALGSETVLQVSDVVTPVRERISTKIRSCMPGAVPRRPRNSAKYLTPQANPPVKAGLVATPVPASNAQNRQDEGGSNGGNGDGNGNGKKKKNGHKSSGSGEMAAVNEGMEGMIPPTTDVLKAVHLLDKIRGIKVEAVALHPTAQNQREYRERLFGPPMWAIIHELQKDSHLREVLTESDPAKRVEKYYALQAAADAYKSGDIPEENIALMLGLKSDEDLMKLVCEMEGDKVIRKKSIELAPGNGEISRTFIDIRNRFLPLAHFQHAIPQKGQVLREVYHTALRNAIGAAANPIKTVDPNIQAVDIVQKFVDKGRKKLIDARRGDICDPLEALYEETGLVPNQSDYVVGNLFFDRVSNLNAALRFAKTLAKPDGSTQFLFGFYAPFSPKTDSFSKNENIPRFDCFDPFDEQKEDVRKSWVSNDLEKPLSRSETIYRMIYSLIANGFKTTRVAEHEYEVYSAHCISETAGVLRTDPEYAFLKDYDFKDEELNARRDAVFNGELHDDELVGFPERENIILISGNITVPEDGKAYERIDFDAAVKQKRLDIDPTQPRFAFLKDFVFPRRRFSKLRDKIFKEGKPSHMPFRAHMKNDMVKANKEYLKQLRGKDKDREPGSNR